jgi:hypothetical protein
MRAEGIWDREPTPREYAWILLGAYLVTTDLCVLFGIPIYFILAYGPTTDLVTVPTMVSAFVLACVAGGLATVWTKYAHRAKKLSSLSMDLGCGRYVVCLLGMLTGFILWMIIVNGSF